MQLTETFLAFYKFRSRFNFHQLEQKQSCSSTMAVAEPGGWVVLETWENNVGVNFEYVKLCQRVNEDPIHFCETLD